MKKIIYLFVFIFITISANAQSPEKMTYQAVIRNATNNLVVSSPVGMQISILQGSPTGTAVYVETHTPTTNANGLATLEIGGGSIVSGTFSSIDWSNGPYFIKTETDPTGGTTYTITGTNQLLSVPYALFAKTAASATEVDGDVTNEIQNIDEVLTEGNNAAGNSINNVSQLTIGSTTPTPSSSLDVNTTNGAVVLPRLTTVQRDALTPTEGMIIYNTTESKFQGYAAGTGIITQIDTGASPIPRSIVNGFWIMHQSITASVTSSITTVTILTDVGSNSAGVLEILSGDGTGGSVLHTQPITYTGCGTGICQTEITLSSPFPITTGTPYTFKFSVNSGGFSTYTNGTNPYAGGQVYQNTTPIPTEDMFIILSGSAFGWVDLH